MRKDVGFRLNSFNHRGTSVAVWCICRENWLFYIMSQKGWFSELLIPLRQVRRLQSSVIYTLGKHLNSLIMIIHSISRCNCNCVFFHASLYLKITKTQLKQSGFAKKWCCIKVNEFSVTVVAINITLDTGSNYESGSGVSIITKSQNKTRKISLLCSVSSLWPALSGCGGHLRSLPQFFGQRSAVHL